MIDLYLRAGRYVVDHWQEVGGFALMAGVMLVRFERLPLRELIRRTPPHLRGREPVDCGEGKVPEDGHWFAGPDALVRTVVAKPQPEVAYRRRYESQDAALQAAIASTRGGVSAEYDIGTQLVTVRAHDGARLAMLSRSEVLAAMIRHSQGMPPREAFHAHLDANGIKPPTVFEYEALRQHHAQQARCHCGRPLLRLMSRPGAMACVSCMETFPGTGALE